MNKYGLKEQEYFIRFLLSSSDAFARSATIIKSEYFDDKYKKVVDYIKDYADNYVTIPTPEEIEAKFDKSFPLLKNINENHVTAFLDEVEQFCKHSAFYNAIMSAPDMINSDAYEEAFEMVKEAVQISLLRELGTDYYKDIEGGINRLKDRNNMVSTGLIDIDNALFGGINRGEIQIFAGASGTGKSIFLQNIMVNCVKQGLNCVYITCELSEELVRIRLHSMLTCIPSKEVWKKAEQVQLKVSAKRKSDKYGSMQIKFMPPGTTSRQIEAYLKEYEIQTQSKVDALFVDYLDLLHPNNKRVNPSDLFVKDKYVTEELRTLGAEWGILNVTASQLNRDAVKEGSLDMDMSMIAGGISKINTADNVMAIYTSESMRERGEYRVQFLKTRSSSGVGKKVYLGWDGTTLRLYDHDGGTSGGRKSTDEIKTEIKSKTETSEVSRRKPSSLDDIKGMIQ